MKTSLLRLLGILTLGSGSVWANQAPTIHWNLGAYTAFPSVGAGGWFQVAEPIANDPDNDGMSLQVYYLAPGGNFNDANAWQAFIYNPVSNSTDFSTLRYWVQPRTDGKAMIFRAEAIDSHGASSGRIYQLVKPNGTSFVLDDLPQDTSHYDSNSPSTLHYQFLNCGAHQINSRILGGVISSLTNLNQRTIWFQNGVYDFDSSWGRRFTGPWEGEYNLTNGVPDTNKPTTWHQVKNLEEEGAKVEVISDQNQQYVYNPGSLGILSTCFNITFKAENIRGAVLRWASYSSTGTTHPSGVNDPAQLFVTTGRVYGNAALQANQQTYTRVNTGPIGTEPRPWPLPAPFISVNESCANIRFLGLQFVGNYSLKGVNSRADRGVHLEIFANNTDVNDCTFSTGPGWSVLVAPHGGVNAQYVHFNSNAFNDTSGDGLNVQGGDHTYIVGNNFTNTGDDAIVINGGTDNHVLYNTIFSSGWRGILVVGETSSDILNNTISNTALFPISISPDGSATSRNINVTGNALLGIPGGPSNYAHHDINEYYTGVTKVQIGAVVNDSNHTIQTQ